MLIFQISTSHVLFFIIVLFIILTFFYLILFFHFIAIINIYFLIFFMLLLINFINFISFFNICLIFISFSLRIISFFVIITSSSFFTFTFLLKDLYLFLLAGFVIFYFVVLSQKQQILRVEFLEIYWVQALNLLFSFFT